jgi:hypothetical protein
MVENDESGNIGPLDLNSKITRVLLILVSVFLIFAGPTYVSYLLSDVLNVNYVASVATGFALFVVGLVLMLFLIRKKVIA